MGYRIWTLILLLVKIEAKTTVGNATTTSSSFKFLNLSAYTFPTLSPVNSSFFETVTLPTLSPLNVTLAPLNLSGFTFPTLAPFNWSAIEIPTLAPFNWSALPTLPPLNFSFPTFAPLNLSAIPTLPPFNWSAFEIATLPTFNWNFSSSNLTMSDAFASPLNFGSNLTLPTLAPFNWSAFEIPTLAPFNWSALPTFAPFNLSAIPTLPPFNLSAIEIPTLAPFNWSALGVPTMAPLNLTASNLNLTLAEAVASPLNLGNFTLPTLAPFNWSALPTFAPLNLSAIPTLPPFNWSAIEIPTLAPFNWSALGIPTMAPLNFSTSNLTMSDAFASPLNFGNLTNSLPTFTPLNLSALPTLAPFNWSSLGLGTLPTFAPLNLSAIPTLAPFNWSAIEIPTLPTLTPFNWSALGLGTLPTMTPLNLSSLLNATLPPLNLTLPTFNMTLAPLNLTGLPTLPPFNLSSLFNATLPPFNITMTPLNLTGLPTLPPFNLISYINSTLSPNNKITTPSTPLNMSIKTNLTSTPHVSPFRFTNTTTTMTKSTKNLTLGDANQPVLKLVTMATTASVNSNRNQSLAFDALPNISAVLSFCSNVTCNSSTEVCVKDINATESCITRQIGTKYCADNPCDSGMSCYDNVTKAKYTCFQTLDVFPGQCLTTKCTSGQVCYQESGQTAKCIDKSEAPSCNATNEEYQSCTSGCDATCETPNPTCSNSSCVSGCGCIRGYVRIDGRCQLMDQCDEVTTGNVTCFGEEEYTDCMPSCEKSCARSSNCTISTTTAATTCVPGCVCRTGYRRDDSGNCVHVRKCSQWTTCGDNESWSKCHNCESICGVTMNPACDQCWSGCACNDGYSRNSTSGSCVQTALCSS